MDDYDNLEEFKEECGYTIDSHWYPRVTKILDIKSKPGLHYFYASLDSYKEGEKIKNKSAEEGEMVHIAIQKYLTGETPNVPKKVAPAVKDFVKYNKEKGIDIEPNSIEQRVTNEEHNFAGTVDGIAKIDGKKGVLDIKTSQSIYRDYRLQTSAYLKTLKKQRNDIETRWILRVDQHRLCERCGARLRNKGGRKKVKIDWNNSFMRGCSHQWGERVGDIELKEFPDWEEDFEGFLGAKKLWEWTHKKWLEKID
ncbi:MAG: hypothetical protein ABEI53_01460 [Candidatus Magasanikbacteria bacterium]